MIHRCSTDVEMENALTSSGSVMGIMTVMMARMRLDVVSLHIFHVISVLFLEQCVIACVNFFNVYAERQTEHAFFKCININQSTLNKRELADSPLLYQNQTEFHSILPKSLLIFHRIL